MKFLRRQPKAPLNNKTPRWFIDWHNIHFNDIDKRSKRNERLIYLLLAAMLGSAVVKGEGAVAIVAKLAELVGG